MHVKLRLNAARNKQITQELLGLVVVITEASDLTLTEDGYNKTELLFKEATDTVLISLSEILYIESL